jgi:cytochrome P450
MSEAVASTRPIGLFSSEVAADPYPWYAHLRNQCPVAHLPEEEVYLAVGYDAVVSVLHDPVRLSSVEGMGGLMTGQVGPNRLDARDAFGIDVRGLRVLIASDPPEHTRLRRLLSRAFTPRAIAELEPRLREICAAMVDDLLGAGAQGDLVAQVAYPFPVTVIAELLGIPASRRDDFKRWSDALVGALSGGWEPTSAQQSILEMFGYLAEVVADREANPTDDLIGRLVAISHDSDADEEPLTSTEITFFAILLLVAGNETTTNLIGNGYAGLLDHPDEARRLRHDPTLVPAAIEESLRYDGPIQALFRGATEPVTVAGVDIPTGATVMVAFAAANRDPAKFPDPDRFDLDRNPHDHLGLGHGIHYCLGASLARLEARIVAETLLERTRAIEPTGPGRRVEGLVLRGYTSLPVHARPR